MTQIIKLPNSDKPAAILFPTIFTFCNEGRQARYDQLLAALRPHLSQGTVQVFGEHKERRLTTFFTTEQCVMRYSGRDLTPQSPPKDSLVEKLFKAVNLTAFRERIQKSLPEHELPKFNAVFINWFRPPSEIDGDKPDALGWHSDDESSHASQHILSFTYCESNGERLFQLRERTKSSGHCWQHELPDGSVFLMLPGCQQAYKHRIADRKTNLARKTITGGRINLTFRCLKTDI